MITLYLCRCVSHSDVARTCRVGYGDITPATIGEIWVNIGIMIAGLALFASILSGLVDIVQSASKQV